MRMKAPERDVEISAFCGSPVSGEEAEMVREIVEDCRLSRTELAATVCELLDWRRPSGRLKRQEAVSWLENMEALGWWRLPLEKLRVYRTPRSGVRLSPGGEPGQAIVSRLREVQPVELALVQDRAELHRWKELISRYHYLGHRVPFGAALRYFIQITVQGEPTLAGCLQFSSPAWRLQARDQWIGWSEERRREQLQHIVTNSRFLLLPWVQIQYLASHVLSRIPVRLPQDWERIYGVRPLLVESFVQEPRTGTCYRAANWICLGRTQGRGRLDREHRREQPVKSIWVYLLQGQAREQLRGEAK
ncbi:MAG: Druantia anti-phage system protein DruA [Acidobacteriota bacterium]